MSVVAKRVRGRGQDAGHVHGYVAVADDHGPLTGEVGGQVTVVGMPVVPADERDRREAVGQVLTRDAHAPVGLGADGIDELMVEPLQLPVVEIDTVGDVPEEADPWVGQDLVEDAGHRLDGLVIGRDAVADQPERGGEAVEDIDGQGDVGSPEKALGGIEPGWAGADDGDPQRPLGRCELSGHGSPLIGRPAPGTGQVWTASPVRWCSRYRSSMAASPRSRPSRGSRAARARRCQAAPVWPEAARAWTTASSESASSAMTPASWSPRRASGSSRGTSSAAGAVRTRPPGPSGQASSAARPSWAAR